MFERFSGRARQVVVLAQEEARRLGHNYIGTEHLLLGLLLEEEGIAARVLESRKVTSEEVRSRVMTIVGLGDAAATGQIPFTPRAKKVLDLALREALTLGHDYIGTEHILLGLARDPAGVSAQILADLGSSPRDLAGSVLRHLGGGREAPEYVDAFPAEAGSVAVGRDSFTIEPIRRSLSDVTLAVGWVLFALAFGLGLLAGWLIWA